MIKIDARLQAIIDEIDANILVDIGCDHGKVSVKSVLLGKANKVIAVDISKKSLDKTASLAKRYDVSNKVECVLGDGLQPINIKPDSVVIGGMGAREIIKILERGFIDSRYILVAHQDVPLLRKYLRNNDFFVIKDYAVESSKRFYDIIVTEKGLTNYMSIAQLYTGKNMPKSIVYRKKLEERALQLKKILFRVNDKTKISKDIMEEWEAINNELQNM